MSSSFRSGGSSYRHLQHCNRSSRSKSPQFTNLSKSCPTMGNRRQSRDGRRDCYSNGKARRPKRLTCVSQRWDRFQRSKPPSCGKATPQIETQNQCDLSVNLFVSSPVPAVSPPSSSLHLSSSPTAKIVSPSRLCRGRDEGGFRATGAGRGDAPRFIGAPSGPTGML